MKKLIILLTLTLSINYALAQLNIHSPKDFSTNEISTQNNINDKLLTKNYSINNSSELNMIEYDNGFPNRDGYQQIIGDQVALRLTPSKYPYYLKFIYINIVDYGTGSPTDSIEIRVYDNDGINNSPNSVLLEGLIVAAPNFPAQNANSWIEIDVSNHGIIINNGDFYVSVAWLQSSSPSVGMETDDPNEMRTWVYEEGSWNLLADKYPNFADQQIMFRALGITAKNKQLNSIYYDDSFPNSSSSQQIVGDQIALQFTPNYYPCFIKALLVNVTNYGGGVETDSFEVRIYKSSSTGEPENVLLSGIKVASRGISTNNTNANDWIFIDISEDNISINNGDYFASIAWLTPSSPNMGHDVRTSNHRTWIYENDTWTVLGDSYPDYADYQIMLRSICSDEPTTSIFQPARNKTNYYLSKNYPNPFNPLTTIEYQVPKTSFVTLEIYDIMGRKVATLVNEKKSSGNHSINFNASNLSNGIYFYQIKVGDFIETKRMMLLK